MNKRIPHLFLLILFVSWISGHFLPAFGQSVLSKWEPDIRRFERMDSLSAPQQGQVLLIGSSSFTKWRDVNNYFQGVHVFNRGFGGSQLSDLLQFKERLVLPYHPTKVVIYCGENDIAAGKTPQQSFADGKALIEWILQTIPGVKIAFISMKPSLRRWEMRDDMVAANALFKAYADAHPEVTYVDVWQDMLNEEGIPAQVIFISDSLHMNAKGYAIWQQKLQGFVER